ncbi:hypothetical protein PAPHI01_1906 [Pancytospora philotis]|nr:hypothetical protein PAPHI01_1906 [Pancytospora philotis]
MAGFREASMRCYERKDYDGYLEYAQKQYTQTNSADDKLFYEKAKKDHAAHKDIRRILGTQQDDYYGILGVAEDATEPEIGKAYRRLIYKCHPSRTQIDDAEAVACKIQRAYAEIGTEEKRKAHDAKRRAESMHGSMYSGTQQPMDDFFEQIRRMSHMSQPGSYYVRTDPSGFAPNFGFQSHYGQGSPFENLDSIYRLLYRHTRPQQRRESAGPEERARTIILICVVLFLILIMH